MKDSTDQLCPPWAGRVMFVEDAPGNLEHAFQFMANSQDRRVERRGALGRRTAAVGKATEVGGDGPGAEEYIAYL